MIRSIAIFTIGMVLGSTVLTALTNLLAPHTGPLLAVVIVFGPLAVVVAFAVWQVYGPERKKTATKADPPA